MLVKTERKYFFLFIPFLYNNEHLQWNKHNLQYMKK